MSTTPRYPHGLIAALALSHLAQTGEAFYASAARGTKVRSPQSDIMGVSRTFPRRPSSLVPFASLRDLLEGGGNDEDDANDSEDVMNPASDNFLTSRGISRSKFADTTFRSRSVYGTGSDDEERGLNADRISTFSFASNAPKSGSQGALSGDDDETTVDEGGSSSDVDARVEDEVAETLSKEDDVETDEDVVERTSAGYGDDIMKADNFFGSVGIQYSKRKYPVREQVEIDDEQDQLGLHGDRMSTFSFSSKGPKSRSRFQPTSEGGAPDDSAPAAGDSSMGSGLPATRQDFDDQSFGADNFGGLASINMSKGGPVTRPDPVSDGLDNHYDRLSTFSLGSNDDKDEEPTGEARTAGARSSGSRPTDKVNHDDRLGTFSFASSDLQSGSTSAKGTSASNPLPSTIDSNIKPPSSTVQGKKSPDETPQRTAKIDSTSPNQVYTPPQKGSLSSLASSVSIKSRDDRIKEIKEATDPKLLHPDGMNVPRLNSKGDVMSFSTGGGRPNIFQRIEQVNQEEETEGGGDDDSKEDVADKGADGFSDVGDDAVGDVLDKDPGGDRSDDKSMESGDCFIGFDLGTSGARMSIVEKSASDGDDKKWEYDEVFTAALAWDDTMQYDDANSWRNAIDSLLSRAQGTEVMSRVKAICVSGTSATCLLVNTNSLDVSRRARMYNYDIKSTNDESAVDRVMELIDQHVPEKHTARATTGSLAKLLLWNEEQPLVDEALCHQSDYVSMSLVHEGLDDGDKCTVASDWHNCLKLGYDVQRREFPSWMHALLKEGANILDPESVLPSKVISPGEPFGVISPIVASKYGLSSNVMLVGGTTDSNAAFFAAAGAKPDYGTAVTSLGSTLAIKQLSKTFVEDASRGVYSHRFPRFAGSDGGDEEDAWLIGGASNVGCAILRQEGFSSEELSQLSAEIDPNADSSLSYYPLMKKGERFPVADSEKEPVLEPKPESRREYLHGLLQGIGDVERDGFRILGELGASPDRPSIVLSCGGGSKNDMWISMRERRLKDICDEGQGVEVKRASNTEASYGAALLAAASFEKE